MWREKRWLQGIFDPPSYKLVTTCTCIFNGRFRGIVHHGLISSIHDLYALFQWSFHGNFHYGSIPHSRLADAFPLIVFAAMFPLALYGPVTCTRFSNGRFCDTFLITDWLPHSWLLRASTMVVFAALFITVRLPPIFCKYVFCGRFRIHTTKTLPIDFLHKITSHLMPFSRL